MVYVATVLLQVRPMDSINTGVAGQIPCLEAKDSGPATHVSHPEKENGICPSCGYTEAEAGPLDCNGFCRLCADARAEENDREGPHHTPVVAMALDGLRRGAERGWE